MYLPVVFTYFSVALCAVSVTEQGLNVKEICGDLGVMEVPAGADPSQYRLCRDHPLTNMKASLHELRSSDSRPLKARQGCLHEEDYGCGFGYCWSQCGDELNFPPSSWSGPGTWCWTTVGSPTGPWKTCNTYADCSSIPNGNQFCGTTCECKAVDWHHPAWTFATTKTASSTTTTRRSTTTTRRSTTTTRR